ncbi:MAG: NAD-dependent epimerase/dehydratase family protein [Gemmatimonadaceae bacterium]
MTTRRDFLKSSAIAGTALMARGAPALAHAAASLSREQRHKAMELLVLGGTGFIGPHLVRYATARGHRVTIFTRGRHQADLPNDVEHLTGDRNGHLDALVGRRWDAVVDDSATNPDYVHQSAQLLKDSVGRYLFTSSTGVYYPYLKRGLAESDLPHLDVKDPKDFSETYGVAKARCEREVQDAFGNRALVVRPTYIVGPGDTSDRFPYWPVRLAKGGEVLAPGRQDDPVQFIDVRDLSEWMVRLLEDGRSGVYNAVGPKDGLTMPEFLDRAKEALHADARFTRVDDYDFLAAQGIDEAIPWARLAGNDDGMMSIRNEKAIADGLTFRPLAATVRDTLAWWPSVPAARRESPKFTITPEKEATALAAWHARSTTRGA